MKPYEVWMEGHAATGDSSEAEFCGVYEAKTFAEACKAWVKEKGDEKYFNPHNSIFTPPAPTYWSCQFFDNEHNARRSFG
jgi:hypothetical protein